MAIRSMQVSHIRYLDRIRGADGTIATGCIGCLGSQADLSKGGSEMDYG